MHYRFIYASLADSLLVKRALASLKEFIFFYLEWWEAVLSIGSAYVLEIICDLVSKLHLPLSSYVS